MKDLKGEEATYMILPLKIKIHHKFTRGVSSWCNSKSDGLQNRSTRVRTPVALLRLLSGKYP